MEVTDLLRGTHLTKTHQSATALVDLRVVGDEEPSFPAAEILTLVEAERRDVTEGAGSLPLIGRTMGLAGVFDHCQSVPSGDIVDRVHVTGNSPVVDGKDRFRLRRDRRLDTSGVDEHRVPVDVDEDRNRVVMQDGRRRRGP